MSLLVCTDLPVREVVLAEPPPQEPVLGEGPQLGAHLAQVDQVPAIRQALHDVQLQAGRQLGQRHACRCGLEKKKKSFWGGFFFASHPPRTEFSDVTPSYFSDLDVVQLLLPLHDVLHAVHPDVDVAHQHGLAHVLNQAAQRHVEHLKQLLDGPDVLLVVQDCGGRRDVKPTERTHTVVWTHAEAAIIKPNIFERGSCDRFRGTT